MGKDAGKIALGAAIAGAVGYVAGILTAPKSGKETREDIKHAASQNITRAEKKLKSVHTDLAKQIQRAGDQATSFKGKAREEFDMLVARAKKAKDDARHALSSVHEGQGDDQDLEKALKEAEAAVKNLKKYLANNK